LDKNEKKALDDIEEHGCHIINVMEGEEEPKFSYSIGIEKTQSRPDLVVFGLDPKIAMFMINEYYRQISSGKILEPGVLYSGFLEGFDVLLVDIDEKFNDEYFGWSNWYYKDTKFHPRQLIWPSTKGVWPWDSQRTDYYDWCQPILTFDGAVTRPT